MEERKPKVLAYDLEIGPELVLMYGQVWKPYVVRVVDYEYIMCFSYQWLGENKVHHVSQVDFPARFKANNRDDYDVVKRLRDLLDEADVVIAYNGRRFDNTMANTRIALHGLSRPSPYQTIDPLATMRGQFHLPSNKLDDVATFFGIKGKTALRHGDLFYDCMNGCKKSWKLEKEYCNQDVKVMVEVYDKILPYIVGHPNMANYSSRPDSCPRCGSYRLMSKGYRVNATTKYRRFQCQDCGGYCSERRHAKEEYQQPEHVNM